MEPEFVRRGRELTASGAHLEAVKVCRLGLLAHPSQLDGRLILGHALLALARYDEVLAEMRVALELDGLNGTAMSLKGEALLGRGDYRQALDVLEQAARHDPGNRRIPELLSRAREAVERGGSGAGEADTSISWTRDYPGFRTASDSPADPDGSSRITLPGEGPTAIDPLDVFVTADTELASADEVDGDERSVSTIEIDPDLEGIEISETEPPTAVDPAFGGPTVRDISGVDQSSESIELSASDLIPATPQPGPVIPPKAADEVRGFDDGFGSASEPTHGYRGRNEIYEQPLAVDGGDSLDFEAPLFLDNDPERPKSAGFPSDQPRPREPARVPRPSAPVLDELFPEDEDGVSKLEIVDDETGLPRALAKQPHRGTRPPPASLPSEPRAAPASPPRGENTETRRRSADMRVIRAGLGLNADPSQGVIPTGQVAAAPPPPGQPPPRRQAPPTSVVRANREAAAAASSGGGRRISVVTAAILAVILLGGGVAGGVVLRDWRSERQLDAAAQRARQLLETGNYLDHLRAAALLDRALALRERPAIRTLRARVEAATADEFGVRGEAAARVEALGSARSRDARIARIHLALVQGDIGGALERATALAEAFPDDPAGAYLRARAQLERGQLDAARGALETLHKSGAGPLITAGLAEVNRLAGRPAVALAVAGDSELPALVIARARAMAAAGELDSDDQPDKALEALIADGDKPPAKQRIGVSPRQVAEARLALVEANLARGKTEVARAQLAALAETELTDGPLLAAYAEALVTVGDDEAATAAQKKLAELWPDNPRTLMLAARLALRAGDSRAARVAVDSIENPEQIPHALAVRGELALEAWRLDDAVKDLDAAISANPGLIDARLARARVDLARGKPHDALDRLDKLPAAYARERDVVRARALRMAGEVERARSLLEKLAEAGHIPALLERAELEREAGQLKKALAIYDEVLSDEAEHPVALRQRARLQFEQGKPDAAAERLAALADKRPDDPRALLAAARVKTLTGDPEGGAELVESAAEIPGAPSWLLDRERGRARLRLRELGEAVKSLKKAAATRPTDGETWLLLMEIHLLERDAKAAAELLKKATVPLDNNHVLALLRGMEALASDQLERAVRDFQTALVVARGSSTRFERGRLRYWKGRAHEALGQLDKARTELSEAIKLDPRNADAYLMLGEVEFQDKNESEATRAYRRSAGLDPVANPKVHFRLGELYLKDRRYKRARASLETYLERSPDSPLAGEAKRILESIKGR